MKKAYPWLGALLLGCASVAACGDAGGDSAPKDVDLSVEEVHDGAYQALSGPGVIHITARELYEGNWFTFETWVDMEAAQARIELDGDVVGVISGGTFARWDGAHRTEKPIAEDLSDRDAMLFFALPHFRILARAGDDADVRWDTVDGIAAIRLEVDALPGEVDDADGKIVLFLDGDFLPLRIEHLTRDSTSVHRTYGEASAVPRSELPADFFSLDAVRDGEPDPLWDPPPEWSAELPSPSF